MTSITSTNDLLARYQRGDRDFRQADLRGADLRGADLRDADLSGADLRGADLSGAKNLLDPVAWLEKTFDHDDKGILVYKTFSAHYQPPAHWKFSPGSILTEVVNPLPTSDCACGINVATLSWIRANNRHGCGFIWLCRVRWEWLIGAVIPYHTDGKFRVSRLELLEVVQ